MAALPGRHLSCMYIGLECVSETDCKGISNHLVEGHEAQVEVETGKLGPGSEGQIGRKRRPSGSDVGACPDKDHVLECEFGTGRHSESSGEEIVEVGSEIQFVLRQIDSITNTGFYGHRQRIGILTGLDRGSQVGNTGRCF